MGDGRYYSYVQFFNIIFYTLLIMFNVSNCVLCIFKVEKHRKIIIAIYLSLLVSLSAGYLSQIIYALSSIIYYNFISKYSLLVYIILNSIVIFKSIINNENRRNNVILIILFTISCYLYLIFTQLQIIIYLPFSLIIAMFSYQLFKYRISAAVFNDVKSLISDYVFIIDLEGFVIFESETVISSDIFSKDLKIDINNVDSIFSKEITIRKAFGSNFIKLVNKENTYFQFKSKTIENNENTVGHILTFSDISTYINLLDKLSLQKKNISDSNVELRKYQSIVYDLEKEREINNLLVEIANNQEQSMLILREKLAKILTNFETKENEIDLVLQLAKSGLKDVRKVVNTYINYYEGGKDD